MKELEFFDKIVENGYILNDSIKANLLKYLDLVEETNKVMDLTANDTKEEIIEKNFYDSILSLSKFDYENKDADWKNSKDALPRGMQKLKGGYPSDAVYKKS